jgi:hypothetical protein
MIYYDFNYEVLYYSNKLCNYISDKSDKFVNYIKSIYYKYYPLKEDKETQSLINNSDDFTHDFELV